MRDTQRASLSRGHSAYFSQDGSLTIEWYDFGDDAPYESANMMSFDVDQQRALAEAIGHASSLGDRAAFLAAIQARFSTYWQVRELAETFKIAFAKSVDFQP